MNEKISDHYEGEEIFDRGGTFAPATIARIYLDQGKLDEAERIYRQLLERAPADAALAGALAEIERRRGIAPGSELADSVDLALSESGHTLSCLVRVSQAGCTRAQLVTGGDGKLVLRLACFPVDPDAPPYDTALDGPRDDGTQLSLSLPEGALLAAASVGLLGDDGTFTSIAHSKILQVKA